MVVQGTSIPMPPLREAWRAGACPIPADSTLPRMTSLIYLGSSLMESRVPLMATAAISGAWRCESLPMKVPMGVLLAATMQTGEVLNEYLINFIINNIQVCGCQNHTQFLRCFTICYYLGLISDICQLSCNQIALMRPAVDSQGSSHHFLLFINSKSGGGLGNEYLTLNAKTIKLLASGGTRAYVHLFDLFSQVDREFGLKNAQKLCKTQKNVNIIVCGGDGTILWAIEEALKFGIDPEQVCFGVIPIGTGNDFSRSLGWGGDPISFKQNHLDELKELTQKWIRAQKKNFDLWDAHISTYEDGKILYARQPEGSSGITVLQRTFSNYLGVGVDARVSYHTEKKRTRSKVLNLVMYACVGLCCLFRASDKMDETISEFSESEDSDGERMEEETMKSSVKGSARGILIDEARKGTSEVKFKKGYHGLVCLNCTSYMAGVQNVFRTDKMAIKPRLNPEFSKPTYDDGKLEFVCFKNELSLGMERYFNLAGRVTQGSGPFSINFTKDNKQPKNYIHIDGEAMLVMGLKQIRIAKTNLTRDGKIRVLVNEPTL